MLTVSSDRLQELVTNALERMAFVFAETSTQTPGEALALSVAHASIVLRGESNDQVLSVSATVGMIQEVASSMMGCEAEDIDVDDHGNATVSELANVFGGELVMQMSDQQDTASVGLPVELPDEAAGILMDRAAKDGLVLVLSSESGDIVVSVVSD